MKQTLHLLSVNQNKQRNETETYNEVVSNPNLQSPSINPNRSIYSTLISSSMTEIIPLISHNRSLKTDNQDYPVSDFRGFLQDPISSMINTP
jgi:hypothetical protein